jgi:hypothetical protein
VEKPQGKALLGDLDVDGRKILKWSELNWLTAWSNGVILLRQ